MKGPPLADRLTALRDALAAAEGRLDDPALHPAQALLDKAGARTALGDATVVALAGSTGSGKSTLFNALTGAQLSDSGVRRPTTGVAHAATWGGDPGPLLDWLQVPRRHAVGSDPGLDGLVLLDLPDHDSTRLENRLEVDRLVELVDVLVWVMDPQKYADAAVHDRYLRPYAGHAGVLMVVLNQVDRLAEREPVVRDLRGLLDREGLGGVPVVPVSARTGQGLDPLRAELRRRVAQRRAASERLAADVGARAHALSHQCQAARAKHGGELGKDERRALVAALGDAAGVPTVTAAVERSSRSTAARSTGWPPVRWVGRLRADPLSRLHLGQGEGGRTSLPQLSGVEQARLTNTLRAARDSVGADLPEGWRDSLRRVVDARQAGLAPALDRAVAGADLGTAREPRWWKAVGALQYLLLVVALVGGLWLLGLVALSYLQLDGVVPLPRVQRIPLPTLLLVVGLLSGLLLAVVVRPLTRASARRRARRARRALLERVETVAEVELFTPLQQERAAYTGFCRALERAGA